jgi:succinate dehydrogenase / fumarate reductase cytochrome b subunit
MGWSNPRFNVWRRYLATGIATIVVVGNVSFPVAVMAGVIEYDPDAVTHSLEEAAE